MLYVNSYHLTIICMVILVNEYHMELCRRVYFAGYILFKVITGKIVYVAYSM